MFSFYCKKLLRCPATYAAALLFFASLVFSVSEYPNWIDPVSYWNPLFLYEVSMNLGVTIWFIPVVTVLPICFVRKELSRGGVWQLPLLRTSPSRFALGGSCLPFRGDRHVVRRLLVLSGGLPTRWRDADQELYVDGRRRLARGRLSVRSELYRGCVHRAHRSHRYERDLSRRGLSDLRIFRQSVSLRRFSLSSLFSGTVLLPTVGVLCRLAIYLARPGASQPHG